MDTDQRAVLQQTLLELKRHHSELGEEIKSVERQIILAGYPPEPAFGTIRFIKVYSAGSREYPHAAVRVPGGGWATTALSCHSVPNWRRLVDFIRAGNHYNGPLYTELMPGAEVHW